MTDPEGPRGYLLSEGFFSAEGDDDDTDGSIYTAMDDTAYVDGEHMFETGGASPPTYDSGVNDDVDLAATLSVTLHGASMLANTGKLSGRWQN